MAAALLAAGVISSQDGALSQEPVVIEEWAMHYDGPAGFVDTALALAVDKDGNVYVTGESMVDFDNVDYATVKYGSDGSEQFVARYDGPAGSYDSPVALTVDDEGNIYVTGSSVGSGTGSDYTTIKYGPDASELWVARYDGPASSVDTAQALTVDANGNVYVTGYSGDSSTGWDFATVKYGPDGSEQWVVRYDGPASSDDLAHALAVDSIGNVYVTGQSPDPSTGTDYATVKYGPDGNEHWVARYDSGPSDVPGALAVDSEGNVYVTGASSDGTFGDYTTIKYGPDGGQQWAAHYDSGSHDLASALAVDSDGNVYVTGRSGEQEDDSTTIKYGPDGTELWVAVYDGPERVKYYDNDLGVDSAGNVYVMAANDFAVIKYGPDGRQKWVTGARAVGSVGSGGRASALVVDEVANVYITGFSASGGFADYATIKYIQSTGQVGTPSPAPTPALSPAQTPEKVSQELVIEEWVARYDGGDFSDDTPSALVVDGAGNVYVTGESRNRASTIKYGSDGSEIWVARYGGPEGSAPPEALAVDGEGNVYVAVSDFSTVKYGPDGSEQWVARYDGPASGFNAATALAVDGAGNVYTTGSSEAFPPGAEPRDRNGDYATVKYGPDGNELWVARYDGQAGFGDRPVAIAVSDEGNVYVTGGSFNPDRPVLENSDYATVAYGPDGSELWVAIYDGPAGSGDIAEAVVVDDAGNAFVTGQAGQSETGTGLDAATIKYGPDGAEEWVTIYDGTIGGNDWGRDLALDLDGNVYVTGGTTGSGTGPDFATIKYGSGGSEQWVASYHGGGPAPNDGDSADAVAVDSESNIYVAGGSFGPDQHADFATIKYGPDGRELWVARYDNSSPDNPNSRETVQAMAVDDEGNVYVTGQSDGPGTGVDFATVKYSQATAPGREPTGDGDGAPVGAIVGGIVGGVLLLAVGGGVGYWFLRMRKT